MVVTQKITRPTAILSKHDSKCKEMQQWNFIANKTKKFAIKIHCGISLHFESCLDNIAVGRVIFAKF